MYEMLFTPVRIGGMELKNRFVMPAMNSNLADEDHIFTPQAARYYRERALGGYGLQITEFLCVSEEGLSAPRQAGIYDDRFIPGLKALTQAVHEAGGTIFAQLQHAGRVQAPGLTDAMPVGASALPYIPDGRQIHELLTDEIPAVQQKFVDAALRAKAAGFDGVELHGAHGYLLNQFMNKATNKRPDRYGGSVSNRARIVCELVQMIKQACGRDFPVSVRMNGQETMPDGNTIEESAAQAMLIEAAGADILNVSYGTPIETYYKDSAFNLDNVRKIKELVSIPVIGVGRINDPALALMAVAGGYMDLVATGRQSVCDPHFPEKIREGRINEIISCTGCIQRCLQWGDNFEEGYGISCMNNPFSGKEGLWEIKEAQKKKKIAVVGAGPAGLQAAWILAARGHSVIVYEKNQVPGGQYRLACVPPMKQDLAKTVATYMELGRKYGVEYHFGTAADADLLAGEGFDEIIDAVGSVPVIPRIEGIQGDTVCTAQEVLGSRKQFNNCRLLVLGAGLVGAETAELLAVQGNRVTLVDMLDKIAPLAAPGVRMELERRLLAKGTEFILNSKVMQIHPDGITYSRGQEQHRLSGFDGIVLAFGARANTSLRENLEKAGLGCCSIGDALRAGDAKKAIFEATQMALSM